MPLQAAQEAHPRSYAGTLTSPFCSQVPCWILKDYMMKKCAPQITYRSMQFLTFPHVLDSSEKSKFIACCLTFQMFRLRGILWTENKTNNQIITQGCLGKRIKEAGSLSQRGLASVGGKMGELQAVSVCLQSWSCLGRPTAQGTPSTPKESMDSLSESLCRQPVLRPQHCKGQLEGNVVFLK